MLVHKWSKLSPWGSMLMLALAGCGAQPKILTLNYRIFEEEQAARLIALLPNGNIPVSSLVGQDPCNLTVSFEHRQYRPTMNAFGAPGPQFSYSIAAINPVNIATTNPPGCPAVTELQLTVGSSGAGQSLALNEWTRQMGATIRFGNGEAYSGHNLPLAASYFQGRVTGFNTSRGGDPYVTGQFRFVTRLDGQTGPAGRLVAVEGSWAR